MTTSRSGNRSNTPSAQSRRRWVRRLRRWSLEASILLAVLAGLHWYRAQPLVDGVAPALQGRLVEDDRLSGLQMPTDGPVLVHFWATWCPVCKLEEDRIDALSQRYSVLSVAMQSGRADAIRAYLKERELSFPTIADPSGAIAAEWGVQAVPVSFILDRNGRIRFRSIGFSTGLGLRARLWLAAQGG